MIFSLKKKIFSINFFNKIKNNFLDKAQVSLNTFDQLSSIKYYKKLIPLAIDQKEKNFFIYNLFASLICADDEDYDMEHYKNDLKKYATQTIYSKSYLKKKNFFIKNFNKKIKVGFVSHFFSSFITKNYLWPIFDSLDTNVFEIFIFSDDGSDYNKENLDWHQFRNKKYFHDTSKYDYKEYIDYVSKFNLDIIFECNGHTHRSRFGELSNRLANKQGTLHNINGPSGFDFIDFIPVRSTTDLSEIKSLFSEKFIKFENFNSPNFHDYKLGEKDPPCKKNGFVTFGYFGAMHKVTKKIFLTWAKILRNNRESKFFLKNSAIQNPKVKNFIISELNNLGISTNRIILEGLSSWNEYLECYNKIDISFTTYPHNGGSTFMDSLLMGVPIFILNGNSRLASQLGKYHLLKMNLKELIVNSYEEYEIKYSNLSANHLKILDYKKNLKRRIICSEWSNKNNNTKYFETLLKEIFNN